MPRPHRRRTVDSDLSGGLYGPRGRGLPGVESVALTLDGLEALRLVDLEGLYQEAAAERMGVSRATLARMLTRARRAVAEALVERKVLVVDGGVIRRREDQDLPCPVHGQRRRRGRGCRCQGRGRGDGRGRRRDDS